MRSLLVIACLLPLQLTLYAKLRKKRDKLNGGAKKRTVSSLTSNEMTPQKAKTEMYDKWIKNHRNNAEYKELLPHARSLMKADAKKTPGLQLFRQYPCLALKDLVRFIFQINSLSPH